ncbi:unnamed protein product, partial [Closterium sp. NIES-53]
MRNPRPILECCVSDSVEDAEYALLKDFENVKLLFRRKLGGFGGKREEGGRKGGEQGMRQRVGFRRRVFMLSGPIPVFMGNVTGNIYVPFDFRYVVQNFSSDVSWPGLRWAGGLLERPSPPPLLLSLPPIPLPSPPLLPHAPRPRPLPPTTTPPPHHHHPQPRDFGLALAAFYIVGDSLHASLLINRTVEVLEPVGYVSGESVFLLLLAVGLLALLGVWAYGQITKMNQ